MIAPADLSACCRASYGHPIARWLLGDSLHPGGLDLTARLARLAGVGPTSSVLDAGSGRGASAVHLARKLGCRVTGVTLEEEGVATGQELAAHHGVEERVSFVQGDILDTQLLAQTFDVVLVECVLSILAPKEKAVSRLDSMLRPWGRLGITDVTVSGALEPELRGVLGTAGCVGGAMSIEGYGGLLTDAGLVLEHREDCGGAVTEFLGDIETKLLAAHLASKLGKLPVDGRVIAEAQRLLALVREHARMGTLGYGLLVATKPA